MSNFCVLHDKGFVEKARELNLSENTLDGIIHNYRSNHQGEDPSDDYIRTLLQGTNNVSLDSYEDALKVWQNKYSSDIIFSNNDELQLAKQEALSLFKDSAVVDYVDNEGNYVLHVAPPTKLSEYSKENDDIYTESFNKNYVNFSQDKGLVDSVGEHTVDYILERLKNDPSYEGIIELLEQIQKESKINLFSNINVVIEDPRFTFRATQIRNRYGSHRSYYDASTRTIYINAEKTFKDGNANNVLMHELMHAITIDRILGNEKFKAKITTILNDFYKSNPANFKSVYNEDNPHRVEEFVADIWTDPQTIDLLKNTKSKTNEHISLWDKIAKFFKGIFADVASDSLLAELSTDIKKLLETPVSTQYYNDQIYFEDIDGIRYNAGQLEAIESATKFIIDRLSGKKTATQYFTIEGEAGTGKTVLNSSTFYELLLRDSMESTLTDDELLAYRMENLDNMVASVPRQVAEYRFEQDLHKNFREK